MKQKGYCEENSIEHAWKNDNVVLLSNPPQSQRSCKNCGKIQYGYQPPFEWRNATRD